MCIGKALTQTSLMQLAHHAHVQHTWHASSFIAFRHSGKENDESMWCRTQRKVTFVFLVFATYLQIQVL